METTEQLTDLQKVSQGDVDPETARQIHERAEKVREEIRKKHGIQEIAVDIIREMRDAE